MGAARFHHVEAETRGKARGYLDAKLIMEPLKVVYLNFKQGGHLSLFETWSTCGMCSLRPTVGAAMPHKLLACSITQLGCFLLLPFFFEAAASGAEVWNATG
jgi:hypothetical protein